MNWRRFSRIPFSATIAEVLDALDLEPPPEGRPVRFIAFDRDTMSAEAIHDRDTGLFYVVVYANGGSRLVSDRTKVRRALNLSSGTPSAKALMRWLDWWLPSAQEQPTATTPTP